MAIEIKGFHEFDGRKEKKSEINQDLLEKTRMIQEGKEYELFELAKKLIFEKYGEVVEKADFSYSFSNNNKISEGLDFSIDKIEGLLESRLIKEESRNRLIENINSLKRNTLESFLESRILANGLNKIFGLEKGMEYLSLLNKINESNNFSGSFRLEWESGDNDSIEASKRCLKEIERGEEISESAKTIFENSMPIIFASGNDLISILNESINGIYGLITSYSEPEEIYEEDYDDYEDKEEISERIDYYVKEMLSEIGFEELSEEVFGTIMEMENDDFVGFVSGIINRDPEVGHDIKNLAFSLDEISEKKKAKPDFLDLDKDGNKKESMKKAAKEAKGEKGEDEGKETGGLSKAQMKLPEGLRKAIMARKKKKKK